VLGRWALVAPTLILCASYGAAWLIGVLSWNFEADILSNLVDHDRDQLSLCDV
jgi:hypothetical protein